jgi:hypothetical protein
MRKTKWFLVLVLVCALAGPAGAVTLHFDELPYQSVNGLSYQGVTFGFTVGGSASTDANYHSGGPGTITYVQDPSLEGNSAGILTLDFLTPTSVLQFGVALLDTGTLTPGLTVDLYDAGLNFLQQIAVNTSSLISFTEGQFSYAGTPVGRAVLDFNLSSRFALDNLTYNAAPIPGTVLLLGSGLLSLLWRRR